VNPNLAAPPAREVEVVVEADEQWSFVGSKANRRWLMYAWDRESKTVLAFVLGPRNEETLGRLMTWLSVFHIVRYFTDGWVSYQSFLPSDKHTIGKKNTQNIERNNLNFRTHIKRLARRTICFSKSELMHDAVIGWYINQFGFS
jgi:insertion element IS1 protein InsB